MSVPADLPPPSPAPSDDLPAHPEKASAQRILWLLGLLMAGFILLIGLQAWYDAGVEQLNAQSANERVRLFIGEEIQRSVQHIENHYYRLATTSGAKGQQLVIRKLSGHLDKLRHDMLVLKEGGTVQQAMDLNISGHDRMVRQVRYQPTGQASAYVLELIELAPWLDEIQARVAQLQARLRQRDEALAAGDGRRLMAASDELNLYLKGVPSLFLRLGENANRLLYESQSRQADLEAQLARQKKNLELLKHVLILLVVAAITVPGFLVVRQIDANNRQLRATWEEMRRAKEEAERASRTKSEFLSRMSHELRTPLNAILGFGQLLEMDIRDREQADNVQEILHAGRHLLDLINEVLDLARIEAGKMTVSLEPVALRPVVEHCLTLIRPLAEARGIRIVEAGGSCEGHLQADNTRLKQVLLNLLSNAVKYNRKGGEIRLACVADGKYVQLRVTDTGDGLTPEQQGRLFTAFERLDADKAAVEGTGIGLALCKRLVELMGGEIGVESTPGQGSTFWVRLPAGDGPQSPGQV